jgi:hypothetical protein
MKILYLATRGESATPLTIEREVDMLSRLFAGTPVEFQALPWTRAESLVRDLSGQRFDVLHVTAHGESEALQVLNEQGATVMMSAKHILSFLPRLHGPRLIYLNACDSERVAEQLAQRVPFAIGSTLPVGNDQAIHGALSFYWRSLLGGTVQEAFEAAHGMVNMLAGNRVNVVLHEKTKGSASEVTLLPEPRIIAKFADGVPRKRRKFFEVMFGAENVPRDTTQVVFFTDDENVIDATDEEPITSELCAVARGNTTQENAQLWCDRLESWDISGDFRLYAVGVTAAGRRWTADTTLCTALEALHSRKRGQTTLLREALSTLKEWGSTRA